MVTGQTSRSENAAPGPRPGRFTTPDGLELAYEVYGDRSDPAVLFAHGFGQTRHAWGPTASALAALGYSCYCIDGRGHGESAWSRDGHYDLEQFIADAGSLAAAFSARPVWVGASMGGLVGLMAETMNPGGLFGALVLVDITPRWEAEGVARIMTFMRARPEGFASLAEAQAAVEDYLPHRARAKSPERLAKLLVRSDDGRYRWHWDPRLLDTVAVAASAYAERLNRAARELTLPVLLVSGGKSDVVSDATIAEFQQLVPHAEHVRIAHATHMVAGDDNTRFGAVISHFLERLPRSRTMSHWIAPLALLLVSIACAYHRASLRAWTIVVAAVLALCLFLAPGAWPWTLGTTLLFALVAVPLNHVPTRKRVLSTPALAAYARMTPQLSETEQIALEAGTVGWEGQLFSGRPDWRVLLAQPAPALTAEEQAFLDGPVEEVCRMSNDWEITHERADLPPEIWEYLKKHRFFGMIVPKSYGGLGFSAYAHHRVVQKTASVSAVLSTTVSVPNSLGPAELLLHYGTEAQKQHYLPRLARGDEIPCFALTNPNAGSDATSIPDYGVVCKAMHEGQETLGVRLTFDKRYITLAPVATVVGLAFRLHDPEHLLSERSDRGITLALLPRNTPGLVIGRRHFALNSPFQNGPLSGKDVFVPMNYLIGGESFIGQGWRMLVECLSVGRAISLPSTASGGVKLVASATGAYARIRKQFQLPIGRFEGVEEALARIGGYSYATGALARQTAAAVDLGEKPAVPSAIAKYHTTELAREVIRDALDVHGGKAIILGPRNYLGRGWQASPISITVEGANILTRSMIIFGQGAVRCHPYVLEEMRAAALADPVARLDRFDDLLWRHVGFACSSAVRSMVLGLTHARIGGVPGGGATRKFYRKLNRYAAALALCADISMLTLGGKLKLRERLSARLGDVLSQLYIASAMLKRYEDQGRPEADHPFLAYAIHDSVWKMQTALDGVLRNFPIRPVAWLLRPLVFPLGLRERAPSDRLAHRVATLMLSPNEALSRLSEGVFLTACPNNPVGRMLQAWPKVIAAEPLERKLGKAIKGGTITALDPAVQLDQAVAAEVLTEIERELLSESRRLAAEVIAVDDFESAELEAGRGRQRPHLVVAA